MGLKKTFAHISTADKREIAKRDVEVRDGDIQFSVRDQTEMETVTEAEARSRFFKIGLVAISRPRPYLWRIAHTNFHKMEKLTYHMILFFVFFLFIFYLDLE